MISPEQLTTAETGAEQAAARLAALEKNGSAFDATGQRRLEDAGLEARAAATRAARLRADFETQEAARATIEQAAAGKVAEHAARLTRSADAVEVAARAVDAAVAELVAAAGTHDVLVREAGADLRDRGLLLAPHSTYATGAGAAGDVRLGGQSWHPVDVPGLALRTAAEAVLRHGAGRGAARGLEAARGMLRRLSPWSAAGHSDSLARRLAGEKGVKAA